MGYTADSPVYELVFRRNNLGLARLNSEQRLCDSVEYRVKATEKVWLLNAVRGSLQVPADTIRAKFLDSVQCTGRCAKLETSVCGEALLTAPQATSWLDNSSHLY